MSESVSLPALGESVTEGTVTRWLKQVGDRVEVDEPLLEVSTDKVDTEIPSPVAGVIEEILVAEDETVEVGAALAKIGDGSGGGSQPADESGAAPAAEVPAAGAPSEAPQQSEQSGAVEQDERAQEHEQQPQQAEEPQQADQAQQAEQPQESDQPQQAEQPQESDQPQQPQQAEEAPRAEPQEPESQQSEQPEQGERAEPSQGEDAGAGTAAAAEAEESEVAAELPVATEAPSPTEAPPAEGSPSAEQDAAEESTPSATRPEPSGTSADDSHAGYVTPIVRKLAHEKGVELSALTGTGVGGRIRKQDVLDAAEAAAAPTEEVSADETPAEQPTPGREVRISDLRGTTVPMSRLRKVVAERAVVSMQTSAQLTTVVEVDVTRVARLRDEVKGDFLEKTGTKLSFLPFFTLAAAEALKTYPIVNATIDGESIVYPDHENISIAVDTERGLLTPVVRNAGELSLAQLATEIADLASRTRENKLKPDELAGGTFTVTNTGSRGALFDTPLVFLPQVAILGTGIVAKKPVVVSDDGLDAIAIRSTVYLALSYDHRIVDGADAARFLTAVKERLEEGDFSGELGI